MRLIDSDKLFGVVKLTKELTKEAGMHPMIEMTWGLFEDMIKLTATVDAVPVVRCKDCKWWSGIDGDACSHPDCRNPIHCLPDEFCNCGESKENH